MRHITTTLLSGTLLMLAGCANGGMQETTLGPGQTYAPEQSQYDRAGSEAEEAGVQQDMGDQARLQHGEVLATAMAIDEGEIKLAAVAKHRAQNQQVKEFAETLNQDHRTSLSAYQQIMQAQNLDKQDSQTKQKLHDQVKQFEEELKTIPAAQFDARFMEINVKLHEKALQVIDEKLMQAADNPKLQNQLQHQKQAVQGHLDKARQLRGQLGPRS